jgi:outer membrane immunogenic protein
MKYLSITPLVLLLLSSSAAAAQFNGPRIEGRVGLDRVGISASATGEPDFRDNATGESFGGEVGYDANLGGIVVGAYGGIDFSTARFCDAEDGEVGCLEVGRNFTGGLRTGAALSPSVLLYAKGGYSNGRLSIDFEGEEDEESSRSRGGFHIGAGAEFALSRNAYFRAEYVHTRYGSLRDEEEELRLRTRRHQVIAAFGYRF